MKLTLLLLSTLACILVCTQVIAQTKIKDGTVTGSTSLPNASAVLELESNNKGFLMPRVALTNTTTWGLTSSSVSGMAVYNTSTTITSTNTSYPVIPGGIGVYYWDGTGWVAVNPTAANGYYWQLIGNAGTNSGANFLGTTDNHPLVFKVNNILSGYLDSAGGSQNTAFGYGAGNGNYGNTTLGYGAGANNTGGHTVLVGVQAGYSNTGNYNHFVGYQAGYSNSSASYNHFEGNQAGYSNTTGGNNQFIGYNAGYANTTGNDNLYIGMNAGKSANSTINQFVGIRAGQNNTSGQYNMFEGYQAGGNTTTGNTNTFIGNEAGYTNTTGFNNTALGFGTDMGSANLQNAAAIGFEAKVYTSNSMVLGDSSQAPTNGNNHFAVNVGFGVYHPLKRIHIDAQTATNTSGVVPDSLKIDNLATTPGSYNKSVLTIDSVTGYVSKINIGTLGAAQFWAIAGNSGTNGGTNTVGAATEASFVGTKDSANLVLAVNGTKSMVFDKYGNIYAGSANAYTSRSLHTLIAGEQNTDDSDEASIITGISNKATGIQNGANIAGGISNTLYNTQSSIVEGEGNYEGGYQGAIFGLANKDSITNNNIIAGLSNRVTGVTGFGSDYNVVGGSYNVVFSDNKTSYATNNAVFGKSNTDSASFMLMGGNSNSASHAASNGLVSGEQNYVAGSWDVMGGYGNQNYSNYAFMVGRSNTNTSSGNANVLFGVSNYAQYGVSVIGGESDSVYADHVAVTGGFNKVATSAGYSLTAGKSNINNANYSIVGGINNTDSASYSLAAGIGNTLPLNANGAAAVGMYNTPVNNMLLAVGNGTGAGAQSNALTVMNTTAAPTATANNSTVNINGSLSLAVKRVTANYTASNTDYKILPHPTNNAVITISLPDPTTCAGRMYVIQNMSDDGTGSVQFNYDIQIGLGSAIRAGTPSLNGVTASGGTYLSGATITLQSDGVVWTGITQ